MLLVGIFGLALSFFLLAAATTLWMLFAARIIGGCLSAATMPTAMAYVADVTTEEDRGKGMGMIGAAVGLGFIFGPGIGGVFSKASLTAPFWMAGSLALLTALFVFVFLHESLPREKRMNIRTKRPSLAAALQGPVARLYLLQLITTFSLAGLEATFAYFAAERAGLSSTELGYIFMIMGLAGAIVQGGLLGKLIRSFGEGAVIRVGLFLSAVGVFSHFIRSQLLDSRALFNDFRHWKRRHPPVRLRVVDEIYGGRPRKRNRRLIIVRFARPHRRSGDRRLVVHLKVQFAIYVRDCANIHFFCCFSIVSTSHDAKRLCPLTQEEDGCGHPLLQISERESPLLEGWDESEPRLT